jgi:hypothetical protein
MNKKKISFKDTSFYYWFVLIFWQAVKNAFSFSKIGEKLTDILISAIIGGVLVIIFNKPRTDNPFEVLIAFLTWLVTTFLIRLLGNIYNLPSKLNKEKQDRINELEPVEANIEISIPDEGFRQGDKVKLIITNKNATTDIEKCFVRFELIGSSSRMGGQIYLYNFPKQIYQKNILWDRKSADDGTITIAAGSRDVLNIIEVTNEGFDFLFQEKERYSQNFLKEPGRVFNDYLILLKVYGKLSGHPLKDTREFYLVHFEFHSTIYQNQIGDGSIYDIVNAMTNSKIEPRLQIKRVEFNTNTEIKEYKGVKIRERE